MFANVRRFASCVASNPALVPLLTLALALGALIIQMPGGGGGGGA